MPSRKEGLLVLYPEYFDARLSRSEGRRVPRKLARDSPTTEQVLAAAKAVDPSLEPRAEPRAAYPSSWSERRGRVLVRKKVGKQKLLRLIAQKIA